MSSTPRRNRQHLHMDFANLAYLSSPCPTPRPAFSSAPDLTRLSPSRQTSFQPHVVNPPSPGSETRRYCSSSSDEADDDKPIRKRRDWFWIRRGLTGRVFLFWILLFSLLVWYCSRGRTSLDTIRIGVGDFRFKSAFFEDAATKGLQFVPAAHSHIHYMGRWTSTPNHLRMDGAFSGVYFDLSVANTTTVLLSLRNTQVIVPTTEPSATETQSPKARRSVNPTHIAFRPSSDLDLPAAPVSLIARVNQEEYILFPNATGLVCIRADLEADRTHEIRVIAPMVDDNGLGLVQLQGIWMSKHGVLEHVEGTWLDVANSDAGFDVEDVEIGKDHRLGLDAIVEANNHGSPLEKEDDSTSAVNGSTVEKARKKLLEVITDSPGSLSGKDKAKHAKGAHSLLSGVSGWDYLLGEMFEADHVSVALDGMCLIQDCIGGAGSPAGIGDVFFRSGSPSNPYFEVPWYFHAYIPDVMILNLGLSDYLSFTTQASAYNQTATQLSHNFENTYISLVQGIRRLAYPKHPSQVYASKPGHTGHVSNTTPASIPIFIMRPLQGQLEHATQSVVHRLRENGDKSVFWIDTSGWLQADFDPGVATQDFFLDAAADPPRWRLTEQANQRVAVFLHMHVCRYLARDGERCAFLAPEVYEGRGQDPGAEALERFMDEEKGKKLREMFFGD